MEPTGIEEREKCREKKETCQEKHEKKAEKKDMCMRYGERN